MSKHEDIVRKWQMAAGRGAANYTAGLGYLPVAERYDELRERYVKGEVELEDFTAGVVALLKEGL